MPSFLQELDHKISADLPVIEKIESITYMSFLKFLQKESTLSLSFITSLGELAIFLKNKQKELENIEHTFANYLIPLLKEGQSEGMIDSSIPSELLYGTFSGIMSSLNSRHVMEENNISENELAEIGTQLYMKAIIV